MFEMLGGAFGLDRHNTAYALLVPPVGVLLLALNLGLVAATDPGLQPWARRRILRESGLPTLPLELMNALMATATVLVWAHVGLSRRGASDRARDHGPAHACDRDGTHQRDDLVALQHVFDERAAEVARLASDRARLLSEVLDAEERERARLAESLHDGPVQRLVALRQDAAEGATSEEITGSVDAALAETRAIISAFHPVVVRELGFEASLRAAIAPFPTAQSINLTVDSAVDDRFLACTVLLPVAQELVVNAVKHAGPSAINLVVRACGGDITIEVNDDGVGIDSSDASRAVQAGHVGLATVRRRVEDTGGRFEIETRADGGTRSRIVLPIREAA